MLVELMKIGPDRASAGSTEDRHTARLSGRRYVFGARVIAITDLAATLAQWSFGRKEGDLGAKMT
jgi:hypothetical protein